MNLEPKLLALAKSLKKVAHQHQQASRVLEKLKAKLTPAQLWDANLPQVYLTQLQFVDALAHSMFIIRQQIVRQVLFLLPTPNKKQPK